MQEIVKRRSLCTALAAVLGAGALMAGCGGSDDAAVADAEDTALKFDASNYTTVNVTIDGAAVKVRQYRVVYVAKPVKAALTQTNLFGAAVTLSDPYAYQTMIISVPEASAADQTKAIYMAVNNTGWFASAVATTVNEGQAFSSTSDTDHIGAALKAGFVVINLGTRSRGFRAEDGSWAGKSPGPVVDTKAAIRYLRLNDAAMAGSAERIVINGTSGGGGLVTAVGASGNSADYLPYLEAIGAAGVKGSGSGASSTLKDDVFAVVAYCPINNLGNSDAGYEWEYNAIRDNTNTGAINSVSYLAGPQPTASAAFAAAFPAYVNGLGLVREDGSALSDANLRDTTKKFLTEEIERRIAAGTAVPDLGGTFTVSGTAYANDWLTLTGSGTSAKVASIDYTKFLRFVTTIRALKTVPGFDAVGVTGNPNITGEATLFGSPAYTYSNFTEWSWNNNAVRGDGSGTDDTGQTWTQYLASSSNNLATQIKLVNPIPYLNSASGAAPAPYWYVRHGMIDRDTAFAIQLVLHYSLRKNAAVKDANFKIPYLTPHSGNYDVQEAFTWVKAKLAANP